jgi:hypothetical protein
MHAPAAATMHGRSIVVILSGTIHVSCFFWTGFDLNLPLDEFGAVDFGYFQNNNGK